MKINIAFTLAFCSAILSFSSFIKNFDNFLIAVPVLLVGLLCLSFAVSEYKEINKD